MTVFKNILVPKFWRNELFGPSLLCIYLCLDWPRRAVAIDSLSKNEENDNAKFGSSNFLKIDEEFWTTTHPSSSNSW